MISSARQPASRGVVLSPPDAMGRHTAFGRSRNAGLDALRASLTLLVVLHHTAITYGAIGGWFYREVPPDRSVSSTVLVYFCTVNQAFFMGLFFLVAGYLTPAAVARHGSRRYLLDRALRLGLPLLFFGWILGPITIAIARTSRGRPFTEMLASLWRAGTFENGPLWFAQALLIFACVAVFWLRVRPHGKTLPAADRPLPWPSHVALLAAAVITGVGSLGLRSFWPVGVNVWGLQLGYFASYVVLFAFGCWAAPRHWLEHLPAATVRTWWRIALITLPILPVVYFLERAMPVLRGSTLSYVYAFWEPLVAWGLILKLLRAFQRRFVVLDGVWRPLTRRAYAIFIIHPPVVVGLALAWRNVSANALFKFAVTGTVSCAVCFFIAGWLLQVPALRRIL